jgi:hypothetical protein
MKGRFGHGTPSCLFLSLLCSSAYGKSLNKWRAVLLYCSKADALAQRIVSNETLCLENSGMKKY